MNMNFQTYYSKVKGCYLGKNIGGTLGRPLNATAASTTWTDLCRMSPTLSPTTTWICSWCG